MTFRPDALPDFLALFDATAPHIRAFQGCLHLELWQDGRYPNQLTTYSHWASEDALEAYRRSDLFGTTWRTTKAWFAAPAVAHSHHVLRSASSLDAAVEADPA